MPRDLEGAYVDWPATRPDPIPPLPGQPDMRAPSFEGLRWLLRHPEVWSTTHRWTFNLYLQHPRLGACGTAGCAMGIAHLYWGREAFSRWRVQFRTTGRNPETWADIFHDGAFGKHADKITPEVVAGRIDDYLAGRKIRFIKGAR